MKKNKKGSISIEAVLVTAILLPLTLTFFLYAYYFYATQSNNANLNFETGRYVSVTGCSIRNLAPMSNLKKYQGYRIVFNEEGVEAVINDISPERGEIRINCVKDSDKGDEFSVYSVVSPEMKMQFFNSAKREALYVQETSSK